MVIADPADEHHPYEDADGIDQHVDRRTETAGDERLVDLVARGVGNSGGERDPSPPGRPEQQEPEHCVLGCVGQLPQREVLLETRAEIGDRREDEDQRRPRDDRNPSRRHGRAY